MEPDFSGWATKNGLKCSDGRTIMAHAFKHQDKKKVPLVWQHQHEMPANILGHAILENRDEGVYTYAYFNDSEFAQNAKTLVKHGDITSLSIYANNLSQQGKSVMHGDIKEVSLVLAGANPGAFIENVNLVHSDGGEEVLDDEAVIYSGLTLEHADDEDESDDENSDNDDAQTIEHGEDDSVQDVLETLDDKQREVVHYMISEALAHAGTTKGDTVATTATKPAAKSSTKPAAAADSTDSSDDETVEDVFNTLTDKQKQVVYYMIGEALQENSDDSSDSSSAAHSELDKDELVTEISDKILKHMQEDDTLMSRNVFEQNDSKGKGKSTLTHAQIKTIVDDAQKTGSLKESFLAHAQEYGIEDIDILFPDAKALADQPDYIARRTDWVENVISATKHSPFSRIKSVAADITADEARAKGYVKGNLKKDEIIKLLKRVTTPTTIYKKQKLDRDDIVDITDLDIVAWLKAEMRGMLDEELARAILVGDGRESDDEDHIDTDHIRPIAYDNEMYAHSITVASELSPGDTITAIIRARTYYKGTGTPTLYTTDAQLIDLLLQVDKVGRRLYETEEILAAALRVSDIVTVEVMDEYPDIIGIIVNLADYTLGADQGGNVALFDDFDIDYNQYKYLIETRVSGALTKPKSALVVKRIVGTAVTPTQPTYNSSTHVLTIPAVTGVVYSIDGEDQTSGTQTIDETTEVDARPAAGYSFAPNTNTSWTYIY